MAAREIVLGQIGLGSWGPNLLRTFGETPGCRIARVADLDEARFRSLPSGDAPPAFSRDYRDVLRDPAVDAVVLATPSETHFPIGRAALAAGKHLFVEKPLALSSREGKRLADLARAKGRVLMVGHLLMYHPAIEAMALLVRKGKIGRIRHLAIRRRAFGRLAAGCGVLWDLGPHDISIALMVTGLPAGAVSSVARGFIQAAHPEVSYTAISLAGGVFATIEESWLAPGRERQLLAVGDRGMLLFDELATDGAPLKHFAKRIRAHRRGGASSFEYLDGGASAVPVSMEPPLGAECREFIACVRRGREPRSGGANGVAVLRVLEAAVASQRAGGREVRVKGGATA